MDQPRVPAGSPEGGQWASTKSGSAGSSAGSVSKGDWGGKDQPGMSKEKIDSAVAQLHSARPQPGTEEAPFSKEPGVLYRGFNFKTESQLRAFLSQGTVNRGNSTDLARDPVDAQTYVGGSGNYGVLVKVRETGGKIHERDNPSFKMLDGPITFSNVERMALYHTPTGTWREYSQVVL